MEYSFKPRGVCSTKIDFEILEDGTLHNVRYTGGCNGNLKAVGLLAEGRPAREVAQLLKGNTCGGNSTSCADQLSQAILHCLNGK